MKTEVPELVFDWERRGSFPLFPWLCVGASLLAHAATFFLFQISYPHHASIQQAPPPLTLLTASSPENRALLRWIADADPARVASVNRLTPPVLAPIAYRPSYATIRSEPLDAPSPPVNQVVFPPARDPLQVILSAAPRETFRAPEKLSSTRLIFSAALENRALVASEKFSAGGLAHVPLEPAMWRIGIDAEGVVRFRFLQHSSGDPDFDAAAARHLQQLVFAPAPAPISWGEVTFLWGMDAFANAEKASAARSAEPVKKP